MILANISDDLLRRDVHFLGEMLGDVIKEQAGTEAFELVEEIRKTSRERRSGSAQAEQDLSDKISRLNVSTARSVTRAFSLFFDLANLAEDRHRVRVLRLRERERHPQPRSESIGDAIRQIREEGLDAAQAQSALEQLSIELVFTAHPSEAKRRGHRTKIRRMRQAMEELDRTDLLPRERQTLERLIRAELTVLWQSEFLRPSRPTVLQEVKRGLTISPRLWEVVPKIYSDMRRALETCYPDTRFDIPVFLKFGSWIGGDRDGHPHVTCEVTAKTLIMLRNSAIHAHLHHCRQLTEFLSISDSEAPIDITIRDRIATALQNWPSLEPLLTPTPSNERCRQWLTVINWRLEQSIATEIHSPLPQGAYREGSQLEADVQALINGLQENPAAHLIQDELIGWLDLIRVFGLHMNRLDVRQDARVYREAMNELLAKLNLSTDFSSLSEVEQLELLSRTMQSPREILRDGLSTLTLETLDLFHLLHRAMSTFGPSCLGSHITSLTSTPSDILAVLWLWRWTQFTETPTETEASNSPAHLAIVPLFEKIDDLLRAPAILETILGQPAYIDYLKQQNFRQIVMIGYSDSTKDGGYLAACWGLYRAQSELQRVADRHQVKLTFFHGRGGSLGRGGGPAARGIYSLPPESIDGSLRLTEQGEVLAERYDDEQIAYRHLEQVTTATLLASARPSPAADPSWVALMERVSIRSYELYRDLVEQPGFIDFFGSATPIDEIESLNIGSRPARRRGERTLADLRAIPWVFSWTQNRCLIPAWYGMGTALKEIIESNETDRKLICELYENWAFFRATIDNAALALAKSDAFIAQQYARLVDNDEIRHRLWTKIAEERGHAVRAVLALTGSNDLLASTPWLKSSIEVRNPYIDPLNLIQIELIRRRRIHRENTPADDIENIRKLLRLTVQGIAAGMRTTG